MRLRLIYRKINILILLFLLFIWQPVLAASFVKVSPSEVKDLPIETKVEVQGTVVVEPGLLGLQIFYLDGVQIYSYYKDFPDLKVGDEVLVKGEISQNRREKRVKTKTKEDIIFLNHGADIKPKLSAINNINNQLVGRLIAIKGLVIEKTGQEIFINDDTGELTVYVKSYTNIDKSIIKEGDKVEIVGILSQNNNDLRLLPRGDKDIQVVKEQELAKQNQVKQIDYQASAGGIGTIDFSKLKPYFIVSAIILGVIFITLLLIERRRRS